MPLIYVTSLQHTVRIYVTSLFFVVGVHGGASVSSEGQVPVDHPAPRGIAGGYVEKNDYLY
jgi:hypothetical protein